MNEQMESNTFEDEQLDLADSQVVETAAESCQIDTEGGCQGCQ